MDINEILERRGTRDSLIKRRGKWFGRQSLYPIDPGCWIQPVQVGEVCLDQTSEDRGGVCWYRPAQPAGQRFYCVFNDTATVMLFMWACSSDAVVRYYSGAYPDLEWM